ncbi:MAG: hypothetical protein IJ523_01340 [Succinivibrionaceae bacterium]|nr:hypothetical protein [Succinivibrionaceae bacterium]
MKNLCRTVPLVMLALLAGSLCHGLDRLPGPLKLDGAAAPSVQSHERIQASPEQDIPKELRDKAEFSCLKYAAVRLQDEMSLRITQVKMPLETDNPPYWMVVGNKINQENEDRPVSFSCKLLANDLPLWELVELSLFQVTEESVEQMKSLQEQQNRKR